MLKIVTLILVLSVIHACTREGEAKPTIHTENDGNQNSP